MLDSIIYLRCNKSLIDDVKEQAKRLNVTSSEYMRMAIRYYLQTGYQIRKKAKARAGLLHCDIC